ncbi:hypothetical protein SprV_0802495600 [Sparganum proliferum]
MAPTKDRVGCDSFFNVVHRKKEGITVTSFKMDHSHDSLPPEKVDTEEVFKEHGLQDFRTPSPSSPKTEEQALVLRSQFKRLMQNGIFNSYADLMSAVRKYEEAANSNFRISHSSRLPQDHPAYSRVKYSFRRSLYETNRGPIKMITRIRPSAGRLPYLINSFENDYKIKDLSNICGRILPSDPSIMRMTEALYKMRGGCLPDFLYGEEGLEAMCFTTPALKTVFAQYAKVVQMDDVVLPPSSHDQSPPYSVKAEEDKWGVGEGSVAACLVMRSEDNMLRAQAGAGHEQPVLLIHNNRLLPISHIRNRPSQAADNTTVCDQESFIMALISYFKICNTATQYPAASERTSPYQPGSTLIDTAPLSKAVSAFFIERSSGKRMYSCSQNLLQDDGMFYSTGNKVKFNINFYTYIYNNCHNPRSSRPERRTALVAREQARYNVEIATLSENSFFEQRQLEEIGAGYTFFWSSRHKAERRDADAAFAIRNDIVGRLPCLQQDINDHLMGLCLPLRGGKSAIIVSVCTSPMTRHDAARGKFHDDLHALLATVRRRITQRLGNLSVADTAAAAADVTAYVEDRWGQLQNTVQSTTLAVLGRARRQHQEWFGDNDAAIGSLLPQRKIQDAWTARKAEEVQGYADRNEQKNFFLTIKAVYGPPIKGTAPLLSVSASALLTEGTQILQRCAEYFRSVLTRPSTISDAVGRAAALQRESARIGCDPCWNLQARWPQVLNHFAALFQERCCQGEVSQDFKDATIGHLYKRKDNRQLCDNYRGISLLNIAGRILARTLLNRLTNHLKRGLLPESQWGFRRHRGTTDIILLAPDNCVLNATSEGDVLKSMDFFAAASAAAAAAASAAAAAACDNFGLVSNTEKRVAIQQPSPDAAYNAP